MQLLAESNKNTPTFVGHGALLRLASLAHEAYGNCFIRRHGVRIPFPRGPYLQLGPLLSGMADEVVQHDFGEASAKIIQQAGVPCTFHSYRGLGHGASPQVSRAAARRWSCHRVAPRLWDIAEAAVRDCWSRGCPD